MKNSNLSSLQLRHTTFFEVSIVACENGTLEGEADFVHELQAGLIDDERNLWRVQLGLELRQKPERPFAYTGRVRVLGLIEVHPDFPKDKVADAVQVSGGAMLYAVIREMVATITSRSVKGSLMLPTLSFRSMVDQGIRKETLPKRITKKTAKR